MARAVEDHWRHDLSGLVVTRYGHRVPTERIEVVEASHPVPDLAGCKAAERILDLVRGLTPDDLVLCLFSGGGSALLTAPATGLTLQDKQSVNRALLRSGANIAEINCVRKHLSAIKGGRLAAACYPAQVVTLAISDVPGDDPAVIASGPTTPDATTFADALAVLEKYEIARPLPIIAHLREGSEETPKPNDPRLSGIQTHVIAAAWQSLEAAAEVSRKAGFTPLILGDSLEGESRDVATGLADIALQVLRRRQPVAPPCVLLSGGETTVTVTGTGRGGRNAELLLSLAIALDGEPHIYALACDTDGVDGTEDNAGAVVTPDTLARARIRGLDAGAHLANNDGYGFFSGLADLVMTGPTLTNVNDFRAILILPPD
jgi:glycerate 2-kinase